MADVAKLGWVERLPEVGETLRRKAKEEAFLLEQIAERERWIAETRALLVALAAEAETLAARDWTAEEIARAKEVRP